MRKTAKSPQGKFVSHVAFSIRPDGKTLVTDAKASAAAAKRQLEALKRDHRAKGGV